MFLSFAWSLLLQKEKWAVCVLNETVLQVVNQKQRQGGAHPTQALAVAMATVFTSQEDLHLRVPTPQAPGEGRQPWVEGANGWGWPWIHGQDRPS